MPNHFSSAYGINASTEMSPAKTAPETIVIPPTYAKAIRLSAVSAEKRPTVTELKL